jgi:hypothetical protein
MRYTPACCLFILAACSDITRVDNTSVTQTSQFDNPAGAVLRRNGAYRDLLVALSSQVEYSGIISDELTEGGGAQAVADRRVITALDQRDGSTFPYLELSAARIEALRAIQSLETYNPHPPVRIGELFALSAFVETAFVEDMCSGIPLAELGADGLPISGQGISRSAMIRRAFQDFDSASAHVADSDGTTDATIAPLIAIGRARALVDSGDLDGATSALAAVPAGYAYVMQYTTTSSPANLLGRDLITSLSVSVSDREGGVGLPFVSSGDPRIPIDTNSQATFANGPQYVFQPYVGNAQGTPITLASAIEASLVRAEGLLAAGNVQAWADTLNTLRTAFSDTILSNHPLGPDSTTSASPQLRTDVMFRERAFWLFLTGHRQGDARRLIRQYGRSANSVFPSGPYWGTPGSSYGSDVTFIPYLESRNTAYTGCIDRSP